MQTTFRVVVVESTLGDGLMTMRAWDNGKGRLGATAAKELLTEALKAIGAQPGDDIDVTVKSRRSVSVSAE